MAVNAAAIADFAQHQLPQRPAAHAALAAAVTAYLAFVAYLGVGPWRWGPCKGCHLSCASFCM